MSTDLSPADTAFDAGNMEQQAIEQETRRLRRHIGLGETPDEPDSSSADCVPLFLIERAPHSNRGAKCKLPSCPNNIQSGEYRIALNPGMNGPAWVRSSNRNSDFYHVYCFEKIADLSRSEFLDRVNPVTRRTFHLRGLRGNSILDGNYLCDGGAERLILQWKTQRGMWIDKQRGVEQEPIDPAFQNLLSNAGSSTFKYEKVEHLSTHERVLLSTTLAPFESNGAENGEEWNLFKEYLPNDDEEDMLNEQHSLSDMLAVWERDTDLASLDDSELTPKGIEAKRELSEKALRAIRRLSTVPMPDFQSAFFGSSA